MAEILARKEHCVPHEEMQQLTPQFFAFAPLAGAMIVAVACVLQILHARRHGRQVCVGTYIWPVIILCLLVFAAIWCHMGLMDVSEPSWLLCMLVITLCGALMPLRDVVHRRLLSWDEQGLPTQVLALPQDTRLWLCCPVCPSLCSLATSTQGSCLLPA